MLPAPPHSAAALEEKYRTRISPFIQRLTPTLNTDDAAALLAQFTPDARELEPHLEFTDDPLHEEDSDIHPLPDVIHKYRSKILYLTTDECPVYCRYCTRKRKTLLSEGHTASAPGAVAEYLTAHPEVNEIIFSGGDPLMLAPADLFARARIFLELGSIKFLRLHTRAVTTQPSLISEKFLQGISDLKNQFADKHIAMVLHINTAAEISHSANEKTIALRSLGIPLYAQTVLLAGINDNAHALAALCQKLVSTGVQPYYLHQLDRVSGAAHFGISDTEARSIYQALQTIIPQYMLPRMVRDSKQGKFPL